MKKSLIFIALVVWSFTAFCQGGVNFESLTFNEALAKAKAEGKMLFIDCYTSWCGPCKKMTSKVFPQEKVGEYMNKKFICVKYDMEKGEGPALADQFGVRSFPTFLIIDQDGALRHKWLGATSGEQFIALAEEAFDDSKAFSMMMKKYEGGNREKAFLESYLKMLIDCSEHQKSADAAEALTRVLSDEEKLQPEYKHIFERPHLSPRGSTAEAFLLAHREEFNQLWGKESVDRRLYLGYWDMITRIFGKRAENRELKEWKKIEREVKGLKLKERSEIIILSYVEIAKALKTDDIDKVIDACEKEFVKLKKQAPRKLLEINYGTKITEAQKARWEEIVGQLDK